MRRSEKNSFSSRLSLFRHSASALKISMGFEKERQVRENSSSVSLHWYYSSKPILLMASWIKDRIFYSCFFGKLSKKDCTSETSSMSRNGSLLMTFKIPSTSASIRALVYTIFFLMQEKRTLLSSSTFATNCFLRWSPLISSIPHCKRFSKSNLST